MKNRLICLAMCLVMLLSVLLTACGEKSTDEKLDEITQISSENARTLTMWLVTEKKADDATMQAVTDALNAITETKFSTKLVLKFFTEDEYRAVVTDEIRANEDGRNPLLSGNTSDSDSAVTESEEDLGTVTNEYGQFKKRYPELVKNQVDIIYIAGHDMYTEFIDNGWLYQLDSELSASSKKIKEYISSTLLTAAKIDGSTYAIPSNNIIGEYTYMLLDKALMEECSMDGIYNQGKIDGMFNKYIFNYLETVRNHYGDAIVPIDATYEECLSLLAHYWTINPDDYTAEESAFSLFGYRYTDATTLNRGKTVLAFNSLFADSVFCENYTKLNEYRLDGGYFGESVEGKATAIKFATGDITDYEKFAEDYYPVIVKYPTVNVEDVYTNMIGVCSYSVDPARCMQIVTYMNTNVEFRNILQYGVEGENFQYVVDQDGDKIVERLNDAYLMDVFKTGNAFIAYIDPTEDGMSKDIWDTAKQQNRQALIEPLLNFNFNTIAKESAGDDSSTPKLGSVGYAYTYTTGYSREILAQDPLLKKWLDASDAAGSGVYVYHTSKISGQNLTGMIYYYNNNITGAAVEVTDGDGAISVDYTGAAGNGASITVISFYGKKNSSNLNWKASLNGAAVDTTVTFRHAVLDFDFFNTDTYRIEYSGQLTKSMVSDNKYVYNNFVKTNTGAQPVVGTYARVAGEQTYYTYLFYLPTITNPANVTLQPTGTASKLDLAINYTTDTSTALGGSDPTYSMFLVTVVADNTTEVTFNLTVNGTANAATEIAFEADPQISYCGELNVELVRYFNRLQARIETMLGEINDIETFRKVVEDLKVLFTPVSLPSEDIFYMEGKLKTDEVKELLSELDVEEFYWHLLCATSKSSQVHKEDLTGEGKLTEVEKNPYTNEPYHYFSSPYVLYYSWLKANGFAK